MKKLMTAFKNSTVGFISQCITLFVQLILRIVLLKYIGVEIVGINAALASVLYTLSLTELGVQSAIVFHLYEPLKNQDFLAINKIMSILRLVYNCIGTLFTILAVLCIPLLPWILRDIKVDKYVIEIFTLMTVNMAVSYFMAYKRALIFADEKEYISKLIDTLFYTIFSILKIVSLVVLKDYMLYLVLQIFQTIGANYFIHLVCKNKYPYLSRVSFDRELFQKIWLSIKNIFSGKLAGYVYGSTDNLIISITVGTLSVGYLTNYTTISMSVKGVIAAVFNAMTPIVGNMLLCDREETYHMNVFMVYTHMRYFLASLITIPWVVFADKLIEILFGGEFVMADSISILLGIDLYIHIVYSVCCEYISGAGLFKTDKNIAVGGALLNIISSFVLSMLMGIEGVLWGTIISQLFFWIMRSYVVYKYVFAKGISIWKEYLLKNMRWTFLTILTILCLFLCKEKIMLLDSLPKLMCAFIMGELLYLLIYICVFRKSNEYIQIKDMIIRFIHNRAE